MSMQPVISVQHVYKSFIMNSGSRLDVLRDIAFDVGQNETAAIIGHSGCGKTTLLRIVCGFETSDSGCVLIDGCKHSKPDKNAIMLFQDFNQLLPWKTVLGNITYPLIATKTVSCKKDAVSVALNLLEDVGLSDFADSYPHQLSGGMKQRVAVARCLALRPRALLMDEPFASLDDITRGALQRLTGRVCDKYEITVLMVTHSVDEAVNMANKIIVMDKNPGSIMNIIQNPYTATAASFERSQLTQRISDALKLC
jgi:NitT/TauT family transport system ATP-binding protein